MNRPCQDRTVSIWGVSSLVLRKISREKPEILSVANWLSVLSILRIWGFRTRVIFCWRVRVPGRYGLPVPCLHLECGRSPKTCHGKPMKRRLQRMFARRNPCRNGPKRRVERSKQGFVALHSRQRIAQCGGCSSV
jgi:hypothetical protein